MDGDPLSISPFPNGLYCPGCGYDLRGLISDRCPECGLTIDPARSGLIAWERRKSLGHIRSFFPTLVKATFSPAQLAKATGSKVDVRSARLFRWIVRGLVILPVVSLFVFAVIENGGLNAIITIDGPERGSLESFWEPRFLWTVGATLWPTLPIGFAFSIILATGVSHWFFMKRLEPVRQNRAMAFSHYLAAPMGWIAVPAIAVAVIIFVEAMDHADSQEALAAIETICGRVAGLCLLLLVIALVNSLRAVDAATQCGIFRSLVAGVGVIVQAVLSLAIGLALFPSIVGLFRLMISSLWR